MRSFAIALAVCGAVLLVLGLTQRSGLVYTPGATSYGPVVALAPGQQACVAPIVPPSDARFDRVRVFAGTAGLAGPPLEATVTADGGAPLGRGRIAGGYRAGQKASELTLPVGSVAPKGAITVCVRNAGSVPMSLFGAGANASAPVTTINGAATQSDVAVRLDAAPRSLLAALPDIAERASLFKPEWLSPWVLALVALIVLAGVPVLLARALRADDITPERARSSPTRARTASPRAAGRP